MQLEQRRQQRQLAGPLKRICWHRRWHWHFAIGAVAATATTYPSIPILTPLCGGYKNIYVIAVIDKRLVENGLVVPPVNGPLIHF